MTSRRPYADRTEAGRLLAGELVRALEESDADLDPGRPMVLALPRGGVPVAVPVARRLEVPLSVLVVRKLGAPGQPELAIGAIAAIGDRIERVLNEDWVRRVGLSPELLARIESAEIRELQYRVALFGAAPAVADRIVIVVDDGLATGATMRAAVAAVRAAGAAQVVAAAPVGSVGACADLDQVADLVVCPRRPDPFYAVGEHYRDFSQLDDEEVLVLLS